MAFVLVLSPCVTWGVVQNVLHHARDVKITMNLYRKAAKIAAVEQFGNFGSSKEY